MVLFTFLLSSLWDIQIPFSQEVKYYILGISSLLIILVLCLLIWQIYKYCKYQPASKHTDFNDSMSKPAKNGNMQSTQIPDFQQQSFHNSKLLRSFDLGSSTDSLGEIPKEEIQGSLRFSLFYDQSQSQLVLTVLEAQDLVARESSGSVDPFVFVRVLWDNEQELTGVLQEWQTHRVKNSCNPMFGDQFSCVLSEEDVPNVTVRLEVRDFKEYPRHGILGEVRAPLSSLQMSYPLEMLEDLQKPRKDIVGEILLSLKYLPTSHRLEVGVLKIKTVFRSSEMKKALYARTKVLCNGSRTRHQRTTEKTRLHVTVFNEVLVFRLPKTQIKKCIIMLSVYEVCHQKKISKSLIGQLSFGKREGEEDDHWSLMMQTLRQPVAEWHLLYL
ncbi:synaptotagmin-2 [Trichomycterus rosablanca]|uniref:synaptotagmin-2 n=1 Tax=Trichomycterus rosablanca TaxID=2290929 RepID=UPI002F35078E